MIKYLLTLSFLFSFLNAQVTVYGVIFDDFEEPTAIYIANYLDLKQFYDLGLDTTVVNEIIAYRSVNIFTSLQELVTNTSISPSDLALIRSKTHNLTDYEYILVSFIAVALNLMFFGSLALIISKSGRS